MRKPAAAFPEPARWPGSIQASLPTRPGTRGSVLAPLPTSLVSSEPAAEGSGLLSDITALPAHGVRLPAPSQQAIPTSHFTLHTSHFSPLTSHFPRPTNPLNSAHIPALRLRFAPSVLSVLSVLSSRSALSHPALHPTHTRVSPLTLLTSHFSRPIPTGLRPKALGWPAPRRPTLGTAPNNHQP